MTRPWACYRVAVEGCTVLGFACGGRPRSAGWLDLGNRRYPQVSYVLDPPGVGSRARIAS